MAPRTPTEPLSRTDRQLLDDLARRVSAVARELRLSADLQRSREQLVLAREEERRRVRRTLHDELGPAIAGLGLRTEAARRLIETDPTAAAVTLARVRDGAQGLVSDIRELAYNLRPPALDELGLVGALRQHAQGIQQLQITLDGEASLNGLPAAVESAAYRIAVEAVTNVVRHAGATRSTIRLAMRDGSLEVRVSDNGRGLPSDVRPGVGIAAMTERAEELGGTLRVARVASGGVAVVAVLPVREDVR